MKEQSTFPHGEQVLSTRMFGSDSVGSVGTDRGVGEVLVEDGKADASTEW